MKPSLPVTLILSLALVTCASHPFPEGAVLIRLGTLQYGVGFEPDEVHVPFVDTVRIVFRNDVDPSWQMAHSVAIATPGREKELVASLRAMHVGHHEVHEALRGSPTILAMTDSLEPGASETIEFHPPGPGTYEYICLVPGHADRMRMTGRLVVEKRD